MFSPCGYLGTNKVPTAPHTFFCLLSTWCACRRCRKTWGTRVRFCQPCVVMRVRVHVCVVYMHPDWHRWDPCEESVRANLVGHQTATTPTSMANTGNTNGWLHPSARKPPPPSRLPASASCKCSVQCQCMLPVCFVASVCVCVAGRVYVFFIVVALFFLFLGHLGDPVLVAECSPEGAANSPRLLAWAAASRCNWG